MSFVRGFVHLRDRQSGTSKSGTARVLFNLKLHCETFIPANSQYGRLRLRQLHEQGQFISKSLRSGLDNAELRDVRQINAAVKLHAGEARAIKLLFAPGGSQSFYYVASWPNGGDDLEAQRRQLTRLGILDRLAASCHNATPFELLGSEPTSGNEGVAVNPLWTPAGCWVVVSFLSIDVSRVSNTPASWTAPAVQIGRSEALSQP